MSYQTLPYTYGSKTLAQINSLTGCVAGDTVYNTTWNVIEVYTGSLWTNDQGCVKDLDREYTPQVGDCVKDSGTANVITLSTSSGIQDFLGVVGRFNSSQAFVAHMGLYSVLVDYDEDPLGVTTGLPLSIAAADAGRVQVDLSPSTSTGIIGYAMETVVNSGTVDYPVKIALQTVEMY
jgi:hypothetical protein